LRQTQEGWVASLVAACWEPVAAVAAVEAAAAAVQATQVEAAVG